MSTRTPTRTITVTVSNSTASFLGVSVTLVVFFLAAGAPTPLFGVFQREWLYPAQLSTVAFAVYAVALLVSLLTVGSLSDRVGRKRVLLVAVIVELAAMVLFLFAGGITEVIVARIVQGFATGAATSALTAWVVELAPSQLKSLASIVGGAAATAGLGLGALFAGAAVEFSPIPGALVFGGLALLVCACLIVVAVAPETVVRSPASFASLLPHVSVPRALREDYVAFIPVQIAGWMFSALFIGLSPTIVREIFRVDDSLVLGAVAFAAPAAAATASIVLRRLSARRATILGSGAVVIGAFLLVGGLLFTLLPLFIAGGVVGGFGFGASFSGGLRTLLMRATAKERAGVSAALFVVAYLAFGIPAVIAGELVVSLGPLLVVSGYVAVIAVAAVIGGAGQLILSRRDSARYSSKPIRAK